MSKILNLLGASPRASIVLRKLVELNFRKQKQVIKNFLASGRKGTVLDLGCGTGEFSPLFSAEDYTGLDIDAKFIAYATHKYHPKKFVVGDGTNLPFGDQSFDKILIAGVLHHLDANDCRRVLSETKRILKTGGQVLIMEDTKSDSYLTKIMHAADQGHYIRTFVQWREFFQADFDLRKSFTFSNGLCFYSAFFLNKRHEN